MATCRDILYNNAARDLTLVAGERGLDRVITWSSSILVRPVNPWNNGGELAFYYGAGMDNSETGLNELVEECCDANLAGLVILLGNTYVLEIPSSVIQTANKLNFPLFTVDSEAYVTGLQQSIVLHVTMEEKAKAEKAEFWRSLFLEDLRENDREIFNKAHYFGVDPAGLYCVYVLRFDNMEDYVESSKGIMQMDHAIFVNDFLDNVNKKAEYFIAGQSSQIWTLPRQKDLVVIAPENAKVPASKTIQLLIDVCHNLETTYPKARFIIGKGMTADGVLHLRESYIQARRALTLPLEDDKYLYDYNTMGIYKILFNINSKAVLDDYIQNTIYRLREYDVKYNASLFDTLQVYLDNRGNVSKAAADLYIHRNTFLQRLAKIENILEVDLSNNQVFYDLQFSMQIFFYLYDTSSEVPFL